MQREGRESLSNILIITAQTRAEHTPLAQLRHHISEPILSTSMDAEGRGSPRRSCSCNRSIYLMVHNDLSAPFLQWTSG